MRYQPAGGLSFLNCVPLRRSLSSWIFTFGSFRSLKIIGTWSSIFPFRRERNPWRNRWGGTPRSTILCLKGLSKSQKNYWSTLSGTRTEILLILVVQKCRAISYPTASRLEVSRATIAPLELLAGNGLQSRGLCWLIWVKNLSGRKYPRDKGRQRYPNLPCMPYVYGKVPSRTSSHFCPA